MRLEFSPESQFDLMEIAAFIARDSPARAKSFVDELEADCGRLTTLASERRAPSWLMLCECYRTGVTSFCQPSEDVVRIARVLHGARDMGTAFLK